MFCAGAQGPLSRFGDTAANTGTLAMLEDVELPAAGEMHVLLRYTAAHVYCLQYSL